MTDKTTRREKSADLRKEDGQFTCCKAVVEGNVRKFHDRRHLAEETRECFTSLCVSIKAIRTASFETRREVFYIFDSCLTVERQGGFDEIAANTERGLALFSIRETKQGQQGRNGDKMKYRLMMMVVAAATAFIALPIMAATTWYVNGATGSDSYTGTSESFPKATIQSAVEVKALYDGTGGGTPTGNHGLSISYYDAENLVTLRSFDMGSATYEDTIDFFETMTPSLVTNTSDIGECLDFGNTDGTCRFHGKYVQYSTDYFWSFMKGYIVITEAGLYEFGFDCDDSCVIYIDGQKVVGSSNNYDSGASFQECASVWLSAGTHAIVIVYGESNYDHGLTVCMKRPSESSASPLSQSILYDATAVTSMIPGFYRLEIPCSEFDSTTSIWNSPDKTVTLYPAELYATECPEYTMYAFASYMWMEGGVTYNFRAGYDDRSTIVVNGETVCVLEGKWGYWGYDCQENEGSYTPTISSWYPVELRAWNRAGEGGATTDEYHPVSGFWYNSSVDSTWRKFEDAGDGDRFRAVVGDNGGIRAFTVTFDLNGAGGDAPTKRQVVEGAEVGSLPTVTRDGHTLAGWFTDANGGTQISENTIVTNDVTYYAQWEPISYTVAFNANGGLGAMDSATVTITVDEGATIYYTLDGSVPNPARPEAAPYQGPFEIEGSAVIRAIAVKDNYYDSEVASFTVTRPTWTFGEYLNCPERMFATGGDAEWVRAKGVSDDGYALRSGAVGDSQTSRLETVVYGAGTVTFAYRVEGEIVKKVAWDGLAFCIDGVQQGDLMGENTWTNKSFTVIGDGKHTLSWLYVKDEEGNGDGEDCAWLDEVTWKPADPIPPVTSDDEVAEALAGTTDADIAANVTNAAQYAAYRDWALSVTNATTTAQSIKDSARAWLSYALGADALIGKELTSDDIRIVSFGASDRGDGDASSAVTGRPPYQFKFEVEIDGVNIGGGSVAEEMLKENLKKVLGIEGAATLAPEAFSPDNIEITFDAPVDGKARFTATRRLAEDGSPHQDGSSRQSGDSFFMRVKVK